MKGDPVPENDPASATHYVVLHTQVGPTLKQGQVVSAARLREETRIEPRDAVPGEGIRSVSAGRARELSEENFRRLLDAGAVRPATEHEAAQTQVTLPGQAPTAALEERLADHSREIARLRLERSELQEKLRRAESAPPAETVQGAAPPMEPRQRLEMAQAIEDLRGQMQNAAGERDRAVAECDQFRARCQELEQQLQAAQQSQQEEGGEERRGRRRG
jgi:DNA repair exonuclease SbcCD ATPase subunit